MADYAIVVLVGVIAGLLVYQATRTTPPVPAPVPSPEPSKTAKEEFLEVLAARVGLLENRVQELPSIWTEERKRAERHRARAEESERRTRELVEPSDEDEWDDEDQGPHLHASNAAPREPEPMHPVRGGVAGSRAADVRRRANAILGIG